MTVQIAIAVPAKQVRSLDTNLYDIVLKPQIPATAQNDSQVILTMPHAARLIGAHLRQPNSVGAGCTLKLQKRDATSGNAVDITASTTAATAGVVAGTGLMPIDLGAGDTIELLVSGAAASVAALEIDLLLQRA